MVRVSEPFPADVTLVFGGAHSLDKAEALRDCNVDALMVSFEYIRRSPAKFHETIGPIYDEWPVRRYLDSGVSTLIRLAFEKKAPKEILHKKSVELFRDYYNYLKRYGHHWDHVAEIDVDNFINPETAAKFRTKLNDVAPKTQLIPIWHEIRGELGWQQMCDEFPYVGIGSDITFGNAAMFSFYRHLVDHAHSMNRVVHMFGSTKEDALDISQCDTSDSVTWLSSQRFARYPGGAFIPHGSASSSAQTKDMARAIRFLHEVEERFGHLGVTADDLLAGKVGKHSQHVVSISLMLDRQEELRARRRSQEARKSSNPIQS